MADENKINQDPDALENLSPEELQEHIQEEKKNAKRSLRFAFTALIAIIAVCIAWFVSNRQVRVNTSNIAASDVVNFELATTGKADVIDTRKKPLSNFIEKIGGVIGDKYFLGDEKGTVTSTAKSSIQWNMSGDHQNFANVKGSGQIDGTGDENIGLQPGTYGELTFYIIPKIDGEQTVNCTLHLAPYVDSTKRSTLVPSSNDAISFTQGDSEKNVYEITDTRVKHVLSGHIYFFKEINENELYSSWLQPDENGALHFSVKLDETTKKDTPKTVTIYWNWPTLISQVLLKSGDQYLGGRDQLFSEEAQKKIVEFMCAETPNNSSFFFIDGKNQTASVDKKIINKIHEGSWKSSEEPFTREEYSQVNQPYNNADQFLGKTVSYVSLELDATN